MNSDIKEFSINQLELLGFSILTSHKLQTNYGLRTNINYLAEDKQYRQGINPIFYGNCQKAQPLTKGFAQFGLPLLAYHLLVLLINFSNLALANRVFSGQASSRITHYPNCAKPWTLAVTLLKTAFNFKVFYLWLGHIS